MYIMRCIKRLPAANQSLFFYVLEVLFGSENWMELDYDDDDFEVSTILWALQVGAQGLARGWTQGQTPVEIFLGAEGTYLTEVTTEDEMQDLRDFAHALCV